jgi:hypothetical protein
MKRAVVSVAFVVALALGLAPVAGADTTLGSTAIPGGSSPDECSGVVIAQLTSDPATPYAVPTPPVGPLTSWQINTTGATAGNSVTLVILRSTGANSYTVAAADTQVIPSPPPPIATYTVPSPITLSGGEVLALYSPSGSTVRCYFKGGATSTADSLISLHTATTPSAGQGLTQSDESGGGYTLNLSATLKAPPPATKKKCKKHKKKRSAEAAKKKCKKKKKG